MDLENLDTADLEKAYEPPPDNIKSPSYNIVQYVMASTKSPFKENYNDDNDVLNITISPSTMQNRENMLKRLKKKRESFHAVASPKQKENIKIRMIAINSDREEAESNPQKPKLPDFPPSKQIDLDSDQEEKENNLSSKTYFSTKQIDIESDQEEKENNTSSAPKTKQIDLDSDQEEKENNPAPSLKPKCINSSASSSVTPKKPKQRKSPIKQKILDSSYSSESPSPKKSVRNPQTKKSNYKSSKKAISSSENSPTPVKPSKNSKKQNTKNTKNLRSTKPQKKINQKIRI